MCDLFRVLFCGPQWDRLDWVSEQQWQFRRYSDPPKRRRHEGCTAPLAQMWGKETASCTQPTFVIYHCNLSWNERIFSHMHLVLVNDDSKTFCEQDQFWSCLLLPFCGRGRLQQSLMRASLKPCLKPSQRTYRPKTSVLGLGQFLYLLWGEWFQQDR